MMNRYLYLKTSLISLIVAFGLNYYASAQNIELNGLENDVPTSIALTDEGQIILAGYTKSFDDGSDQAYIIKLTSNGYIIWEKTLGNKYGDRIFDICIEKDQSIFITGESWLGFGSLYGRENMFLAHIDKDGNLLDEKSYYAYHRDMGLRVKQVNNDEHIVVGYTKSMADKFGEVMIVYIDQSLDTVWKTILGETRSSDYGFDIIENDIGYIVVGTIGGFFNSVQDDYITPKSCIYLAQLSTDGSLVWEKSYGGTGHDWIEQGVKTDDGLYFIGSTQSIGSGSFDMLLLKTDFNGDSLFATAYGNEYFEHGRSIVYSENRLYLGGQKKSEAENISSAIYLVCTDMDGYLIWERTIESTESDKLVEMTISDDGKVIYCLAQSKNEDTHKDFWLFSIDTSGNIFSVTDLQMANYQVYPNPVSSQANIDVNEFNVGSCEIIIYNELGQIVDRKESLLSGSVFSFSTHNLASGFYTYHLNIGNKKNITGKFIVH